MSKSILCTPVGLQTPEGIARVNKAVEDLNSRNADVASVASDMIALYLANDRIWLGEMPDLVESVEHRDAAYQEMLRAVAGYPPPETEEVTA